MSGKYVEIDMAGFEEFFRKLEQAARGDFRKEFGLFLEGIGDEFLRIVQDEIIRMEAVDTRLLLSSFQKGSEGNIWKLEESGLTLEIGTNVEYAKYVNDGHWTMDKYGEGILRYKEDTKNGKHKAGDARLFDGRIARFVPGYWQGDRFIYDPSSDTGMVLKQQWIKGKPYFDSALRILDRMFPELLEKKLQEWLDTYFGQ